MPLFKAISSVKDKLTLTPNELQIKEATSNDDSLVSTSTLHAIAEMTFQPMDYPKVMEAVWSCLRAPRHEWRRIQRSVLLCDILMKFGSSRCVQELRDFVDRFKPLQEFRFTDEDNNERGAIIREKSRYLVEVLADFNKIEVERDAAKKQKNKCIGMSRDDANRERYKRNTSYEDVKGFYNVSQPYRIEKPPEKEVIPEQEEKKMATSSSQNVISVERPNMPTFEAARIDRGGVPSAVQPTYTTPQQAYFPAPTIAPPQPVPSNPQPAYYSPGLIINQPVVNMPPQNVYPAGLSNQPGYNPANFGHPGGNPYGQNVAPGPQPTIAPLNHMYSAPMAPAPQPGYSQVGVNPYGQIPNAGNSVFNPYQANYPQGNPYGAPTNPYPQGNPYGAPTNPYQGYSPSMPGYQQAPQPPPYSMNPGSTVKHNMSNTRDQDSQPKPQPKQVDLESLLMNLDGLQANPKLK